MLAVKAGFQDKPLELRHLVIRPIDLFGGILDRIITTREQQIPPLEDLHLPAITQSRGTRGRRSAREREEEVDAIEVIVIIQNHLNKMNILLCCYYTVSCNQHNQNNI